MEVVVVNNASTDDTAALVDAWRGGIAVRQLFEPVADPTGKARGLNRAIDAGLPAPITAVIDDDISVDAHWPQQVLAATRRWPDCDFFAGSIRIARIRSNLPGWTADIQLKEWILGQFDRGTADLPLVEGGDMAGGNFWFRSSLVRDGLRFDRAWLSEPPFFNRLLEDGHKGMYAGAAAVTHRYQDCLLEPDVAIARAHAIGRSAATMRLVPYRHCVRAARMCHEHPALARGFCAGRYLASALLRLTCSVGRRDGCLRRRIHSAEGMSYYATLLRQIHRSPDYRLLRWS